MVNPGTFKGACFTFLMEQKELYNAAVEENEVNNPMMILMSKLTGSTLSKPHQLIPYNLWGRANRELVDKQYAKDCETVDSKKWMALCSSITRTLFKKLDWATQDHWTAVAKSEHEVAIKAWEAALKAPGSGAPAELQKYVVSTACWGVELEKCPSGVLSVSPCLLSPSSISFVSTLV